MPPQLWLEESFRLAQTVVYGPPVGPGAGPYMLDETYRQQARDLAQRQVALAGARLANLLNAALRPSSRRASQSGRTVLP
jgi:hypothetical protein